MGTKVKRFNVSGQELYVILSPTLTDDQFYLSSIAKAHYSNSYFYFKLNQAHEKTDVLFISPGIFARFDAPASAK